MEVVSLLGSPRTKGNSAQLARIITAILADKGNRIHEYCLNNLNIMGCQACGACKGISSCCTVDDDLAPVLEAVKCANVIILATPVYWGDISAQLKTFIDRTYSYLTPGFMTADSKHRLPKGKKLVFIQTQGAGKHLYGDVFERYNSFFKVLNFFDETYLLRGCELNELGGVDKRDDLVRHARAIAETLG